MPSATLGRDCGRDFKDSITNWLALQPCVVNSPKPQICGSRRPEDDIFDEMEGGPEEKGGLGGGPWIIFITAVLYARGE